jgi:hypothetical protein
METIKSESIEPKFESLCASILKHDAESWEVRNKAVLQMTEIVVSYAEASPQILNDTFTASIFRMLKEPVKNMVNNYPSYFSCFLPVTLVSSFF